jgi:hypothetical protein
MKWLLIISTILFLSGIGAFILSRMTSRVENNHDTKKITLSIKKMKDGSFSFLIGTYNYGVGATGFGLNANEFNAMFKNKFTAWNLLPLYFDEFWDMPSASNVREAFESKLKDNQVQFVKGDPRMMPYVPSGVDKLKPIEFLLNTHYSLFCFCDSTPSDEDRQKLLENFKKSPWDSSLYIPSYSLLEYEGHGGPLIFKDSSYINIALSFLFPNLENIDSVLDISTNAHKARYKISNKSGKLQIEQNDFDMRKRLIASYQSENRIVSKKFERISLVEKAIWYLSNRIQSWSILLIGFSIVLGCISVLVIIVKWLFTLVKGN